LAPDRRRALQLRRFVAAAPMRCVYAGALRLLRCAAAALMGIN
jgi:hypothetical protein